jgi:hypothetical protein
MLVKAFNNIYFKHLLSLARPTGAADGSCLPIAGDSAPAKAAVTEFIESVGYSVVDAGPLADRWRQATGTPVWGTPYGPYSNAPSRPSTAAYASARLPRGRSTRRRPWGAAFIAALGETTPMRRASHPEVIRASRPPARATSPARRSPATADVERSR